MGLLQQLPTPEQVTGILAPVLGDEAAGTGVAGVLQLLDQLDTSNLSASLSVRLDQNFSVGVSADASAATTGVMSQFQQAIESFPEPSSLIQPLTARFDQLKNLSTDNLSTQLLAGIDGLQNIESLFPPNARELIAGAADRIMGIKDEFISGEFGQLRQWSESVQKLYAEIQPLISGGSGAIEDRLLEYLRAKITDLVRLILPGENLALAVSSTLDAAISADKLLAIGAIKADLTGAMGLARAEFEQGNFTNTAHFAAAQAAFQRLTEMISAITTAFHRFLDQPAASVAGLSGILQQQFDYFREIEIVDLGNIKDKFAAAIQRIEDAIKGLDLGVVRRKIEEVFEEINGVIGRFDLNRLTTKLADLQNQLQIVLDALDGALYEAIAAIRAVFTKIKDALRSIASALGSYDEQGVFHFHIQQQIEGFLNGVKQTLQETIRPLLEEFKSTIGQTLQQVRDGLNAVKGEIEAVKARLEEMLQGVNEELQSLDVAGTVESTRQKLEEMLNSLGVIDFDPVVDPVVGQINEMSTALKKIDVSSLNEFTIGALKVAVEVVVAIDFSVQITDALMAEFDKLLEIPKNALGEIETSVEGVIERFGQLAPAALLAPLDDLFDPITAHLDALKLETLIKPLDEWYGRAQQGLDQISPATLLQPLIDLHARLTGALDSISPAGLISPLREAIEGVKAQIRKIDVTGLASELSGVINRVKSALDQIAPDRLLTPLVTAFDKIIGALDGFDPAILLKPFADIFGAIAAPLANLTADHARLIGEIFTVLRGIVDAFDPRTLFRVVREKAAAVSTMLQQLGIGGIIAALKGPYDAMSAAFETGGGKANASLSVSVEGLNPLRNVALTQAAADLQTIQSRLDALAQAEPPADLANSYDTGIRKLLESLIPAWAKENISADSIRRAFQLANPLNLTAEINRLYEAIKQQLHNFDPRILQEQIKASFEKLTASITSLDPQAILSQVQGVIDALIQRLDGIDLQLIADELDGVADEVRNVIAGLDPRPIIAQLQGLVDEVKGLVAALQPSQLLSELNEPFELSKAIVAEFNPATFKEPLQTVFENIQTVLAAIDIGIILKPLAERLEQLRSELEEGLKRTETAFNGMLQAIPV
jgi:vacuolar-type H+-ATPase subunit E/Vma4